MEIRQRHQARYVQNHGRLNFLFLLASACEATESVEKVENALDGLVDCREAAWDLPDWGREPISPSCVSPSKSSSVSSEKSASTSRFSRSSLCLEYLKRNTMKRTKGNAMKLERTPMMSSSMERYMKPEKNPKLSFGMCVPYLPIEMHVKSFEQNLPHDVGQHGEE